ncbi:hypothetical protein EV360DRAFT_80651 [Lentinula raphanica]|nr:hypothetical protein EV360DRAFT_80651 [Lentinula raphanica]
MTETEEPHIAVDNTMGAAFIGVICAARKPVRSLLRPNLVLFQSLSRGQTCHLPGFNQSSLYLRMQDLWYIRCLVSLETTQERPRMNSEASPNSTVYSDLPFAKYDFSIFLRGLKFQQCRRANEFGLEYTGEQTFTGRRTERFTLPQLEVLFNARSYWIPCTKFLDLACVENEQPKQAPHSAHRSVRARRVRMLCCHHYSAFTISSLKLVTWEDLTQLKSLSMTVNVLGAVADVLIAAGLFYFLHRSRTGFKKSDTMISKLIMFTVSTGLLTSICAVASLLSILIWGKTLIYVAFYFSLGRCSYPLRLHICEISDKLSQKVYSNSLLATLNARKSIRGLDDDDGANVSFSLQTFSNKFRPARRNMTMAPNQTNISIKIDTTQELVRDKATKEKDLESDITDVVKSEDTCEAI